MIDMISFFVPVGAYCLVKAGVSDFVLDIFMVELLKLMVVTPKTSKLKEMKSFSLKEKKMYVQHFDGSTEDYLISSIKSNMELRLCGENFDCAEVVKFLFNRRNEFLVYKMDYIVITKMGITLLVIEMTKHKAERSILIDLTMYKTNRLHAQGWLAFSVAAVAAVVSSNRDACAKLIGF